MVEITLQKGISLQPFKDLLQSKEQSEVIRLLRGALFTDRFDHPPWYRTKAVVRFEELVKRKPEDVYYGQHNILYFVYRSEFKEMLKKLFK